MTARRFLIYLRVFLVHGPRSAMLRTLRHIHMLPERDR